MSFGHLDDPQPPPPDEATRDSVARRRGSYRRGRRLLVSVAATAATALAAAGIAAVTISDNGAHSVRIATNSLPSPTPASSLPSTTAPPATATPVTTVPPTPVPTSTTSTTVAAPAPAAALVCGSPLPFFGGSIQKSGPVASTVVDGPITAELSGTWVYGQGAGPSGFLLADPRLRVTWSGRMLIDEAVTPPSFATMTGSGPGMLPWPLVDTKGASQEQPLCIARMSAAAGPLLLIGFDSGGAHCCDGVRAIPLTPAGTGVAVDMEAGNPGISLEVLDGEAVIVTADDAFAYTFGCYACSGMPILIYRFSDGNFRDVTLGYPSLLRSDAAVWWKAWSDPQNAGNGLGALAGWAADQCRLGQCTQAFATIDQLNAQGKLTGPQGWPEGTAYVSSLRSFLQHKGYMA